MRLIDKIVKCNSRTDTFHIYSLGDLHIGAMNCAEGHIRRLVKKIKDDPKALWVGGGDYCVPYSSKILTKRGFVTHDDLLITDSIASYVNGNLVWGKLKDIWYAGEIPMVRMRHSMFDFVCSPNHNWLIYDGHRARRDGKESDVKIVSTKELKKGQRILITAPMKDNPIYDISVIESALLGWLVTDGHTSKAGFSRVIQKKLPYAPKLISMLRPWTNSVKTFGNGTNEIYLNKKKISLLCQKIGINILELKQKLPLIVCGLSQECRLAMFNAMLEAEGWKENRWRFSQKKGPVLEAFQILATLLGKRLGFYTHNNSSVEICSVIERSNYVGVADIKTETLPKEQGWCPVTEYGNWVCLQPNGQITITGNCNAIKPQDSKRFTPDNLPNWILEGDADTVRKRLKDIVHQEAERFILMVEPIKDKCIGLISGNHEESIVQHYNEDILEYMCETLGVPNLTRSAGIRLNFKYGNLSHVITIFITHGHGGGRSAGAEPNQLESLAKDKDFDIILRGHSHTFCILAPIPVLSIPTRGKLPKELDVRYKRCANWGCMMMSYKAGPSTYDEKALYPARCLSTLEIEITPLRDCEEYRKISMSELVL